MSAAATSVGISCPDYVAAAAGARRCRFFEDGGGCVLAGRSECSEWRRANPHRPTPAAPSPPEPPSLQQDLFGSAPAPVPAPRRPASAPSPTPAPRGAPGADSGPAPASVVSEANVASFRATGAEVLLDLPAIGEVWLVAELTGQSRREMLPEQLAFLANVAAALPGARVVALKQRGGDAAAPAEPAAVAR